MNDLENWKDSPLWDDEESAGRYAHPLRVEPAFATSEGTRIATDIPESGLYRHGSFVCAKSAQSHIGPFKHAMDFLVPDGTPVYAACGGTVVEVEQKSNQWGPTEKFRDMLNYITILHDGGEYTQYCHLAQWSCRDSGVLVGKLVSVGTKIGVVGKTGWTSHDHLHFIVFRLVTNESPFGHKSLKPRFI